MTATLSHALPARFQLADAATWAEPWPMYRALRDHDPVHHVVPDGQAGPRLLRAVPARRHLGRRPRPRDLLVGAGPDGQLRRAGTDRPGRQSADGDAGPAGAHRIPQAGVPRLHARARSRPSSPRSGSSSSSASSGCAPTAAATSSPSCSSRCRRWSSRTTSACPRRTATSSTAGPRRSSRPTPPRAASPARSKPLGDALGGMMAYFTALIERRRVEPEDDTVSHLVAAGVGADGDIAGMLSILAFTFTMVTGGNDTTTGMLGGVGAAAAPAARPTPAAGREPRPDTGCRRRVPAAHLAGAGAGPHRHPRRHDRRHHHPRRPQGAVPLRLGQPRRAPIRRRRRRTRRDAQAAQHPDVQPRRAPLPGRGRGPHAVPRRADRTAGALPGLRGRRVRNRLGRRQLRAAAAVGPVHGER